MERKEEMWGPQTLALVTRDWIILPAEVQKIQCTFFSFLESKGKLESNIFSQMNLIENRIGLIKDKIYPGEKDQVRLPSKL